MVFIQGINLQTPWLTAHRVENPSFGVYLSKKVAVLMQLEKEGKL